jgi:hypothetical protein
MTIEDTIARLESLRFYAAERADRNALSIAIAHLERTKPATMPHRVAGAPLRGTLQDVPNPYAEEGQE